MTHATPPGEVPARLSRLAVRVTLTAAAIGITESSIALHRAENAADGVASTLGSFAQSIGFSVAFALAALTLFFLASRVLTPEAAPRSHAHREGFAAILLVFPVAISLGLALFSAATQQVHNQELAALVATSSIVAVGALGMSSANWLAVRLARFVAAQPRCRRLLVLPGSLVSAAGATLAYRKAHLEQLDGALWLTPAVAAVSWLASKHLTPLPPGAEFRIVRLGGALWLAAASLLGLGVLAAPSASVTLATRGAWSRPAIALLRRVTDFDGDGYSSWFGGGDCAALDAAVHPGAREIPGDGVDNNCVGGDATRVKFTAPRASGLYHAASPQRLNLVLVTIETLRADHTSVLGYSRKTTPELDDLATSSIVFETSYAPTPTTRLSLTTLLSGVMPSKIRWLAQEPRRQMRHISPETPWLPAWLEQHGYRTLAVHTDFRAFTAVENAGFERGFSVYDTSTHLLYSGGTMHGFPGGAQVDRALSLLDESGRGPFLLWLHLVEPHYVYERSGEVPDFGRDDVALYDADIAEADRQLGRLLRGLSARGLLESSVVLVTGDHGEEFGEHGERWHGSNLYDPQLRTLSLLRIPSVPARRIRAATSLADFAPTLLDILGFEDGFRGMMGRNLAPLLLQGRALASDALFLENFSVDSGAHALYARLEWPYKCILNAESQRFELFDVSRDPAERTSRFSAGDARSERCREELTGYLDAARPLSP
jgi:arylsulfatase A-like enzyme